MATVKSRPLGERAGADQGIVTISAGPFSEPAGSAVDTAIFIADKPYRVFSIEEVHSAVGGSGAVVTPKKCTGTEAPASGDALVTAAFDLTATVNAILTGTLTATEADLELADGDRICLDFGGTLTSLAGCNVTIQLLPLPDVHYWVSR